MTATMTAPATIIASAGCCPSPAAIVAISGTDPTPTPPVPEITAVTVVIMISLITANAVADVVSMVLPLLAMTATQGGGRLWSQFSPQGGAHQAAAAANVSQVEME